MANLEKKLLGFFFRLMFFLLEILENVPPRSVGRSAGAFRPCIMVLYVSAKPLLGRLHFSMTALGDGGPFGAV